MTPKDMLTNPSFCPIPWTGLMYNVDGTVKNCIRSDFKQPLGNLKNGPIESILLGEENLSRQEKIINKLPVPSCHTCKDLEGDKKGLNIISDRVFYIRELKSVSPDTYTKSNFNLKTIDVRWSNLCNQSCVYCSPEFSSQWASELNSYPTAPTLDQRLEFKKYIFDNAHNLKHVYLAGGEPMLMKENMELLAQLNPEVNLRINTNLSKIDTKIFNRVCEFKNVHWTVSVESMEDEYNYIRYGGDWDNFLDNLEKIQRLDHKISFNMLHFLLNYRSIFGCVDFLKDLGFHNNSFVIGALLSPDYLNIRHLPETVLQSVKEILSDRINEKPGYLLEESYKNMLAYLQTPSDKNLKESFERLKIMDNRRNLDSSKIFKDLYKLKT